MPQSPALAERQPQRYDSLPSEMAISMPDGSTRTYPAGTPVQLIRDEIQSLQGAPSLSPLANLPTQSQESGTFSQLGGEDVQSLGNMGLETLKIIVGLLGPHKVQGATRMARALSNLRGVGPRITGTSGIAGVQAALKDEPIISNMAEEAGIQAIGELGAPVIQGITDNVLIPTLGLYTGSEAALKKALAASRRQANEAGPLGWRPQLGNKPQVERRKNLAKGTINTLNQEATDRGVKIPASELRGGAKHVQSKSSGELFPESDVDIPVQNMEDQLVVEQLAKRTGTTAADLRAKWKMSDLSDSFNLSFFSPNEIQEIVNAQAKRVGNIHKAGEKNIVPMSEDVKGQFGAYVADRAKRASEKVVPGLGGARHNLADFYAMQAVQPKIRSGLGSMAIRGAAGMTLAQALQAAGIDVDTSSLGMLGVASDPRIAGTLTEVLAKVLQAAPTLYRANKVEDEASEYSENVGIRRRQR